VTVAPPVGEPLFQRKNCVGGFTTVAILSFIIVFTVYASATYNNLSNSRVDARLVPSLEVFVCAVCECLCVYVFVCVDVGHADCVATLSLSSFCVVTYITQWIGPAAAFHRVDHTARYGLFGDYRNCWSATVTSMDM